jgi:SAM-dependent methyltransferase
VPVSARAPLPPMALADRVCSLGDADNALETYDRRGAEARAALLDLLPEDWSFDGRRVLDFGCGAGRTLRHFLDEAQHAEVWGVDIDAPSIEWLEANLSPPLHVIRNGVDPPLGLDYGSFDLIWALSVFTHLTDNSLPWLAELHRLLKEDGLLVATYMGRWNAAHVLIDEPWEEDRIGMNVLRRDQAWEQGGPMVLMSDWWVRAHWGRAFEILDVARVQGQSWMLLRKREIDISVADLERPADDPREYVALRHNLLQVERDNELALRALRRDYERSLSWRITGPLRHLGRFARGLRRRSGR